MEEKSYGRQIAGSLLFLSAVVFFFLLKVFSDIAIRVTIAALMALVMRPVAKGISSALCSIPGIRSERCRSIRAGVSVLLVTVLMLLVILTVGTLVALGIRSIVSQYSKYEQRFLSIYKYFADKFKIEFIEGQSFYENIKQALDGQVDLGKMLRRIIMSTSESMVNLMSNVFIIVLMFAFLLAEMMGGIRDKIKNAFSKDDGDGLGESIVSIVLGVVDPINKFLFIKFFMSLATGVIVYLVTFLTGTDFAVVWGFLAFALNFIPTFGSIVSVAITTIFALVQFFPNWPPVLAVCITSLAANMIIGNIIEPRLEGEQLHLSPFVILVSLSLWGWMWSLVGMLLAVPLTVIVGIVCQSDIFSRDKVPMLHYVASFLG